MAASSSPHDVEALLAHAAWLRSLARNLLLDSERAEDVVQQTWVKALEHPPRTRRNLRAWLGAIARNIVRQNARGEQRRSWRESLAAAHERLPATEALVEGADLQRRLVEEVLRLKDPYRTVVLLRFFAGRSVREIAADRGVPIGTVETHVKRAIAELRERLDCDYGDRRRWAVLLLPFAGNPAHWLGPVATVNAVLLGGFLMTTKVKVAIAAAVVLTSAIAWWLADVVDARYDARPVTHAEQREIEMPPLPGGTVKQTEPSAPEAVPSRAAVSVTATDEVTPVPEGSLLVKVTWAKDHAPAEGVWVRLVRPDAPNFWVNDERLRTAANGSCCFERLALGRAQIYTDRNGRAAAKIEAGKEAVIELEAPIGIDVGGIVVDARDEPVGGADIWMSGLGGTADGEIVTQSRADGTFELRSVVPGLTRVNALAPGRTPSLVHWLMGSAGTAMNVKLVLEDTGGEVMGRVFDADDQPVTEAIVRLGIDHPRGFETRADGSLVAPSDTITTRTDANGGYHFRGFPAGLTELAVRARGCAPAREPVTITLAATQHVDVHLLEPGRVSGTITDASGKPVGGADVVAGAHAYDLLSAFARSDANGHYQLDGVIPGDIQIKVDADQRGQASQTVTVFAGEETAWNAVVSRGGEIVGRVLDERDQPAKGWGVRVEPVITNAVPGEPLRDWYQHLVRTGTDGRFSVPNCRDVLHLVSVSAPGSVVIAGEQREVRPGPADVIFRVSSRDLATTHIEGRVVDAEGKPAANVKYSALRRGGSGTGLETTGADGRMHVGPSPQGRYTLVIEAGDHARLEIASDHELAANETWHVGDIALRRGGTLVVTLRGTLPADATAIHIDATPIAVRDAGLGWLQLEGSVARSHPLLPGAYLLQVSGPGIVHEARRVQVDADRETAVDIELKPGVMRTLSVTSEGIAMPRVVHVEIHDASGTLVVSRDAWAASAEAARAGVTLGVVLAPGVYQVQATTESGASGDAEITVADDDANTTFAIVLKPAGSRR